MGVRSSARRGFTIIEMGASWVVVAILAALILPGVQSVRESARRSQCQDHLHTLAIAVHNYESAHRVLPPGSCDGWGMNPDSRYSWAVFLLPFLDQAPLYEEFHRRAGSSQTRSELPDPATRQAYWNVDVPLYLCPSDPQPAQRDHAPALLSYKASVGDLLKDNNNETRGLFGFRSRVRFSEVTDGTSNTLMFGEMVIGSNQPRQIPGGVAVDVTGNSPSACRSLVDAPPRGQPTLRGNVRDATVYVGGRAWDGRAYYAFFSSVIPPNGPTCQSSHTDTSWGHLTASSRHPGGSQTVIADGRVTFMSEGIDAGDASADSPDGARPKTPSPFGVWGGMGTRSGGELIRFE